MNKKDLISIGALSKITRVHIKSLRYYDELGILKPFFVDPDTKYRYYSFQQVQYVIAIQFCVELGIPLKDFLMYVSDNNKIFYSKLVETGSNIAEKKIEAINQKLNFLKEIQKEINRAEKCLENDKALVYKLPEKFCYITEFEEKIGSNNYKHAVNKSVLEISKKGIKIGYEIGIISFFKNNYWSRYLFIDIMPEDFFKIDNSNGIHIKESKYLCRKMDENINSSFQVENLPDNFDCVIVEIDLFTGEYNIEDSKYEIRYKLK